jgi:hypothetical protein
MGRTAGTGRSDVLIREARATDGEAVLGLWDEAIAWLAQRGQPEQWGTEPASSRDRTVEVRGAWHGLVFEMRL